jgi:hypothetical protein
MTGVLNGLAHCIRWESASDAARLMHGAIDSEKYWLRCRFRPQPFDYWVTEDNFSSLFLPLWSCAMTRQILICGLLLVGVSWWAYADDKHVHIPASATNAGLEKMKTLVGTWVMTGEDGKPTDEVVSVIKLTAGGSAIHETIFPGQPHEMVSIYTADGSDLVMTHYCMLGNQPRMKADAKTVGNQLKFEFAGGGNLDPKKDKHMHAATLTIVDADHMQIEGIAWENGAPAKEMCGTMKLARKK